MRKSLLPYGLDDAGLFHDKVFRVNDWVVLFL
jgi:hypothetical protein